MSDIYRRVRAPIFWGTLLFTYVAAILPAPKAPSLGFTDKTDHIAAFLALTILCRAAYWTKSVRMTVLGLSAFGAFIEFSQALPFIGRDASIWDWAADSAAILAGCGLAAVSQRILPGLFANDSRLQGS